MRLSFGAPCVGAPACSSRRTKSARRASSAALTVAKASGGVVYYDRGLQTNQVLALALMGQSGDDDSDDSDDAAAVLAVLVALELQAELLGGDDARAEAVKRLDEEAASAPVVIYTYALSPFSRSLLSAAASRSARARDSRTCGNSCSTPTYQNSICSSSGTLRNVSR